MNQFNVIKKAASLLNLSKTDIEILRTLHERKKLLVAQICENMERSERHIRQRLQFLIEKGFLKREIEVLSNKRLAYRYSLKSAKTIVEKAKKHLFREINKLDNLLWLNEPYLEQR